MPAGVGKVGGGAGMRVRLEFKPQDLWIGVYWSVSRSYFYPEDVECTYCDLWVCLVPMLPIHFSWMRGSLPVRGEHE